MSKLITCPNCKGKGVWQHHLCDDKKECQKAKRPGFKWSELTGDYTDLVCFARGNGQRTSWEPPVRYFWGPACKGDGVIFDWCARCSGKGKIYIED